MIEIHMLSFLLYLNYYSGNLDMFESGLKYTKNCYKNIRNLDATDASKPEVRFAGGCKL